MKKFVLGIVISLLFVDFALALEARGSNEVNTATVVLVHGFGSLNQKLT
jgi:hypothetical protein